MSVVCWYGKINLVSGGLEKVPRTMLDFFPILPFCTTKLHKWIEHLKLKLKLKNFHQSLWTILEHTLIISAM